MIVTTIGSDEDLVVFGTWTPTEAELGRLLTGGHCRLWVQTGAALPPVLIEVVEPGPLPDAGKES